MFLLASNFLHHPSTFTSFTSLSPHKMQLISGSIVLLAALVHGTPFHGSKPCEEYSLPLKITTVNRIWSYPPFEDNFDVGIWETAMGRRDANVTYNPLLNITETKTETYTISGTFCSPSPGGNGVTILATHGGGYDRA
jgi:hypothetical protein